MTNINAFTNLYSFYAQNAARSGAVVMSEEEYKRALEESDLWGVTPEYVKNNRRFEEKRRLGVELRAESHFD